MPERGLQQIGAGFHEIENPFVEYQFSDRLIVNCVLETAGSQTFGHDDRDLAKPEILEDEFVAEWDDATAAGIFDPREAVERRTHGFSLAGDLKFDLRTVRICCQIVLR